MKLEHVDALALSHPFTKGFDKIYYCISDEEVKATGMGMLSEAVEKRKFEDVKDHPNLQRVYTSNFYIGLALDAKPGKLFGRHRPLVAYTSQSWSVGTQKARHLVANG